MCVLFICSAALKQAENYNTITVDLSHHSVTLSQTLAEIEKKSTVYVHRKRYLKLDTRKNTIAREFSGLAGIAARTSGEQIVLGLGLGHNRGSRRRTRLPSVTRRFVFINSGEKTAVDVNIYRHREVGTLRFIHTQHTCTQFLPI